MALFERKKWVGDRQIDTCEPMPDRIDAAGDPLWKVKFIQGGVEYFTKRMLDAVITDKNTDLTDLRIRRMHPIVQEVLKVLSLYGFKKAEFEYLISVLKASIDERLLQANNYLWGVNDYDLSFLDLVAVLEKRDKDLGLKNGPENSAKN